MPYFHDNSADNMEKRGVIKLINVRIRKTMEFIKILDVTEMPIKRIADRFCAIKFLPVSEFAEIMGGNGEGDPLYVYDFK